MLTTITNFFTQKRILFLILLLGLVLRLTGINSTPPALNWDEVSHGYNAYSILKTGNDEWGRSFPLIFRAYGDYKLPVYIYSTVLSIAVFGLNTFAVRFSSVIAGTLLIYFTYLLSKQLLVDSSNINSGKINGYIPLVAAILVAIEPWSLFLSRGAFEANLSQLFIVSGAYFLILSVTSLEIKRSGGRSYLHNILNPLLVSAVLLGMSVWTYNSARVFVPLLLVMMVILYRKKLKEVYRKTPSTIYYSVITLAVLFIPMFFQLLNPEGQARYEWVAIINEGAVNEIIQNRINSELSPLLTRLLYNRPLYFVTSFVSNYLSHFLPGFLFFKGGTHHQFGIPDSGVLYLINLPFFYFGLLIVFFKSLFADDKPKYRLIFAWIILAPIASALTRESPHTLRAITLLPIPMILSSMGIVSFIKYSIDIFGRDFQIFEDEQWSIVPRKTAYFVIYFLIIGFLALNYLNVYYNDYPKNYSWAWQYGYEEIVEYSKANYPNYDKIIVTKKYGEPHEFFLFYWPWDPLSYQNDPDLIRFEQSDWFWVDRFDKFYFVNDWEITEDERDRVENDENYAFKLESGRTVDCSSLTEKCLLITSPSNVPNGWNRLDKVEFLDGETAFELYEN